MTLWTLNVLLAVVAAFPPHDPQRRVHDFAQILPADLTGELEKLCQDVERDTTAQFAVVTVQSLDGQTVEEYSNQLFKDWGIGQKDVNNGVLLLVAPNERRMRIEVGFGLEPLLTDALCGEIRDQWILPPFKLHDFPTGIRDGAREIARILREHPQAAAGQAGSSPLLVRTARRDALMATVAVGVGALALAILGWISGWRRLYGTVWFFVGVAILAALFVTAVLLVLKVPQPGEPMLWLGGAGAASLGSLGINFRRYKRFGPHGCSECGTRLELLSEQADDEKLDEIQRLEEKIGSVDYDVWFCPACLHSNTEKYINYFSGFHECPSCPARAFKEGPQQTITAATTLTSGLARVEGQCVSCKHKSIRQVILPRIVVTSSSSSGSYGGSGGGGGGSFGGGSSGGGGASGSW